MKIRLSLALVSLAFVTGAASEATAKTDTDTIEELNSKSTPYIRGGSDDGDVSERGLLHENLPEAVSFMCWVLGIKRKCKLDCEKKPEACKVICAKYKYDFCPNTFNIQCFKLRAFSELSYKSCIYTDLFGGSSGPWASIAEIGAVEVDDTTIPTSYWTVSASSEESGLPATAAIDGSTSTFWHSQYTGTLALPPHEFFVDMGAVYDMNRVVYTARPTDVTAAGCGTTADTYTSGMIWSYELWVSEDCQDYEFAVQGYFDTDLSNRGPQVITLPTPTP